MRIGIDLMGSDTPPEQLFEAILAAFPQFPSKVHFYLIVTEEIHKVLLSSYTIPKKIHLLACKEFIRMDESPLIAIRRKKESTLCHGLRLLKKGQIEAFITTGNTGALVAASSLIIPKFKGIRKPALLATLPTSKGHISILDVGGNVNWKPKDLVQFTKIGVAFKKSQGTTNPSVGLLNIGIESKKGTVEVQETYKLLTELGNRFYQFKGNIEAREVFQGNFDLVVTDGFTGNILLKTAEGVAEMMLTSLMAFGSCDMKNFKEKYHYSEYPGAIVSGLDGLVIKCHGNHNGAAMLLSTIKHTVHLIQTDVIKKIKYYYEEMETY